MWNRGGGKKDGKSGVKDKGWNRKGKGETKGEREGKVRERTERKWKVYTKGGKEGYGLRKG